MLKIREQITAEQISRIIPDLRLIDTSHYIKDINNNRLANIADIINTATELHFLPHTLQLGKKCSYHLNKGCIPTIVFHMLFSYVDVMIDFHLSLSKKTFGIHINDIHFAKEDANPDLNTQRLKNALRNAQLNYQKMRAFM